MTTNLNADLAALRHMTPSELRAKYLDVFGEPSRSGNRDFLCKRIAWRLQSLAEGSLSERAKARAIELGRDADIRTTVPRPSKASVGATTAVTPAAARHGDHLPMPGAVLTREYRGQTIEVTVLPKGFEWEGQVYRSLSAVAKAVTGSHWNGNLFFGVNKGSGTTPAPGKKR